MKFIEEVGQGGLLPENTGRKRGQKGGGKKWGEPRVSKKGFRMTRPFYEVPRQHRDAVRHLPRQGLNGGSHQIEGGGATGECRPI